MSTVQLGRLAEVNPAVPEFDDVDSDEKVTFMPLEACWPDGHADVSRRARKGDVSGGYTRFRDGDVLLPKITPTFEAGRVFPTTIDTQVGAATTEVHVLRAGPATDARFLAYVARSQPFLQLGAASLQGVGNLRRVTRDFVRSFPVHDVALDAQTRIADYLDRETAQIDTLIAKQEQLIATLRERRAAQISATALDGFNPLEASTSSSPALGTVFEVTLGKMLDAKKEPSATDTRLPYIRAANLQDEGLRLTDVNHMWYSPTEIARLDIRAGDLLVVEGGAVGTSVLVTEDMPGWSFQKTVNRVRPRDDWSTAWLGYVLRAYRDEGIIDLICDGSTIAHLTAEKLRALRIPSASVEEQIRRATVLDEETAKIDTLITKAERFIELSKERRAALITAAVTGQIEVPA